jgi:hypothetical protein
LNSESYACAIVYINVSESRKQIFIYEWLEHLVQVLPTVGKPDIKENQKKMVEQILFQIQQG